MTKSDLGKVLIETKFGQSAPLFDSATDLAKKICAVSKTDGKTRLPSSVATLLSNVFSCQRKCSPGLKNDILACVRPLIAGLSESDRLHILDAIVRAVDLHNKSLAKSPGKGDGLASAEMFFRKLSKPNALLIVEYRDQPRATPEAKYRSFATTAGEAIAAGLHFAMVQPFCEDAYKIQAQKFYHTATVRNFLYQLVIHTREVYLTILKAALDKRGSQNAKDVAKRLVLYERTTTSSGCFVSGIQSKLFLAEHPSNEELGKLPEREVWEWVAGKEQDSFLQRDEVSLPVEVLSEQFLHITKFWTRHKRLPITNAEIEETVSFWGEQLGGKLPPKLWQIFASPEAALKLVERGFGKKPI